MATFFLDNDISFRIAHALDKLVHEHRVLALRDEFPQDAKDEDWLPVVASKGYIVVSRDFNQRRRLPQRTVLRQNGSRVLYMRVSGSAQTLFQDAARLVKNWPKIEKWGLSAQHGEMARLTHDDRIETLSD